MSIDIWIVAKLAAAFLSAAAFAACMYRAAVPKTPNPPTAAEIEEDARAIYDRWASSPGFKPWVDGGNSLMQDHARDVARRQLEASE